MLPSVRAFLSGLIDYAGLFPPAKLPLEQALRNYADYRSGPDAWMLGRFIVPAARLAEVSQVGGSLLGQGPPLAFAVLGRGGNTVAAFTEGLAHYDEEGVSRRRLMIASPGQKILPRSSMVIQDDYIEARLYVKLPARRGRILVSGRGTWRTPSPRPERSAAMLPQVVVRILQVGLALVVAWSLATAALDAVEESARRAQAEVETTGRVGGAAVDLFGLDAGEAIATRS